MTVLDPRADGRRARRLFSTGLMSDTKWRKLLRAIAETVDPVPDHVVVKFIDVAEPKRMCFAFETRGSFTRVAGYVGRISACS